MSTNQIAVAFKKRFETAYKQSPFDSYSELSRAAQLSRPVTQKIIQGQFDHSKVGPGIFSIKRLADALETSVGFLLSEDLATDRRSQEFFTGTGRNKSTVEKLMETHWRGAGRLEAFSKLIEFCDQYAVPEEQSSAPRILRVGRRTLFAGRLGGPFVSDAQRELEAFTVEKQRDVVRFHRRVVREGTAIGNSFLDHSMITRPARVSACNIRLGLLVEDHHGQQSILVHAAPVPA